MVSADWQYLIITNEEDLAKFPINPILTPIAAYEFYKTDRKWVALLVIKNENKKTSQLKLYCWQHNQKENKWKNTTSGINVHNIEFENFEDIRKYMSTEYMK